jgi:hypothetical protein
LLLIQQAKCFAIKIFRPEIRSDSSVYEISPPSPSTAALIQILLQGPFCRQQLQLRENSILSISSN